MYAIYVCKGLNDFLKLTTKNCSFLSLKFSGKQLVYVFKVSISNINFCTNLANGSQLLWLCTKLVTRSARRASRTVTLARLGCSCSAQPLSPEPNWALWRTQKGRSTLPAASLDEAGDGVFRCSELRVMVRPFFSSTITQTSLIRYKSDTLTDDRYRLANSSRKVNRGILWPGTSRRRDTTWFLGKYWDRDINVI